jgi:hypothetical protein
MTTHTTHTNPLESVRVLWSAADEQFFRITAELFSPSYAMGAGVLLASYDPEPVAPDPRPAPVPAPPSPARPAARPAPAATTAQQ